MIDIIKPWIIVMMKVILIGLCVYAIFILILAVKQRDYLYNPSHERPNPTQSGLAKMQVVTYQTTDGLELKAWYQAATVKKPTIIYFHGNAGHLGQRAGRVRPLIEAGYGVLLTSYRGYSGNPGKPSEQGLYNDARAATEYLIDQGVAPQCLILYGESLGSGVAVQIATEYPVGGLVLISPYTSITDVAKTHYPWAPVSYILRDQFNSLAKINKINVPVYIVHGTEDKVVPTKLGQRLFDSANTPKEFKLFEGINHSDFPDELNTVVKSFLAQLPRCERV